MVLGLEGDDGVSASESKLIRTHLTFFSVRFDGEIAYEIRIKAIKTKKKP